MKLKWLNKFRLTFEWTRLRLLATGHDWMFTGFWSQFSSMPLDSRMDGWMDEWMDGKQEGESALIVGRRLHSMNPHVASAHGNVAAASTHALPPLQRPTLKLFQVLFKNSLSIHKRYANKSTWLKINRTSPSPPPKKRKNRRHFLKMIHAKINLTSNGRVSEPMN